MKILKFFSLFLCLAFVISSCTDQEAIEQADIDISQAEGSECQDNFNYPNLPKSDFLDGYYDLLTEAFTEDQLESCECEDLLAVQAFRNENIVNFLPFEMTVEEFSCAELQDGCGDDDPEEEWLIEQMLAPFNDALSKNLILEAELNLMTEFFNDLIIHDDVDYDFYWCQLESVDKPSGLDEDVAGLLSAYTFVLFQGPDDYFTANPAFYTTSSGIKKRIPRWLSWGAILVGRSLVGATAKYGYSMYVLGKGVYDGQDTSYEALCAFLD